MLYILLTTMIGQNTDKLFWSGCQYLLYRRASHTSFVPGKIYSIQFKKKKKQQYLSSCKALVQPIVRAFCVCLIQRKGGIFLIFFLHKKNIFHYYSKGYAVVGKKLLDSAKWLMHIGYFCSKWSYKWYWKPLLSSKYLGETPVNHNV